MQYIDCKKYADEILEQVKAVPNKKALTIITVGDNPASESYVKGKIKDCEYCGIPCNHIKIEVTDFAKCELYSEIECANLDPDVNGIIIQMPLPKIVDDKHFFDQVRLDKDVDGFKDNSPFLPCTPEGIMYILKKELGDLVGLNVLVIGRGKLVGEPLAKMLLDEDCTVTIAHSKTKNLEYMIPNYEVIISAAGKQNLVDLKMCNAKVVIDAGVNRDSNGKLCGDCYNFDENFNNNLKVTSVPGGVGLMTRAMLMKHVAKI